MKTSELIEQIAGEMEAVLDANPLAVPNPHAVRQLKFLAQQLVGQANYAAEKAGQIAEKAAAFYSVRKHLAHRGGSAMLYVEMKSDLIGRMRGQAHAYAEKGN